MNKKETNQNVKYFLREKDKLLNIVPYIYVRQK